MRHRKKRICGRRTASQTARYSAQIVYVPPHQSPTPNTLHGRRLVSREVSSYVRRYACASRRRRRHRSTGNTSDRRTAVRCPCSRGLRGISIGTTSGTIGRQVRLALRSVRPEDSGASMGNRSEPLKVFKGGLSR